MKRIGFKLVLILLFLIFTINSWALSGVANQKSKKALTFENLEYKKKIKKEVFKLMGWKEGNYVDEKEKKFIDYLFKGAYGNVIIKMGIRREFYKYILRAVTEYLFDKKTSALERYAIFMYYRVLNSEKSLKLLNYLKEKFPNDEVLEKVIKATKFLENLEYKKKIKKEVFKLMGWKEGKYDNEREKAFADEMRSGKYGWKFEFFQYKKQDGKYLIRPFTEYLFNDKATVFEKSVIFKYFRIFKDKRAVKLLKYFAEKIPDEYIGVRREIYISLLYQGEYDLYFYYMENAIKEGYFLGGNYRVTTEKIKEVGCAIIKNKDLERVKKDFIHLINISKDDCNKSFFAYFLFLLGEKEIAFKLAHEIDKRIKNNSIILPKICYILGGDKIGEIEDNINYLLRKEGEKK